MAYIVKPLVTEKVTGLTEKHNVFCFVVRPEVKVVSVNTVNYAGKNKSRYTKAGLLRGKTNAFKKAYVTLKEGESIDFFSNI